VAAPAAPDPDRAAGVGDRPCLGGDDADFEFGWGGLVEGLSWATMLADYDVTAGRIWVLVPIWTALAPVVVRRTEAARHRADAG
jgi:hypothetical protein